MGLLETAAADLVSILSDQDGGFAVAIRVVDPAGNAATINGLAADIGISIDPDTGTSIAQRKPSVALPISKLREEFDELPRGIGDTKSRPWTVSFTLPTGGEQTFKVTTTLPDALGCLVCFLEHYQE